MAEDRAFALFAEGDTERTFIHVALVGGGHAYRGALRNIVESAPGFQIVVESKGIADVRPRFGVPIADVVLLDIDDASMEPLDLFEKMQSFAGGSPILLLSDRVEQAVADLLLLAGARGVICKEVAATHLITAIRKVRSGELWIDRATASRLIGAASERRRNHASEPQCARIESLSRREREVVAAVTDGLCNKAIAKKMGISDNTVRHHLTSIYAKLETRDRLELVIFAFRRGVVGPTA
jgi:two-component system, NarL family, nitrate/nitrite response regulator NarL